MAWTQADIDKLKAAIGSGRKKVKYANLEVEYQSVGEMMQTLDRMELEVRPPSQRRTVSVGYMGGS